jgi:hypothetical protein
VPPAACRLLSADPLAKCPPAAHLDHLDHLHPPGKWWRWRDTSAEGFVVLGGLQPRAEAARPDALAWTPAPRPRAVSVDLLTT